MNLLIYSLYIILEEGSVMENSDVVSINSCALDVTIEEFNKKDLQEAGVLIDYNQETEIKIDQNKDKKRSSNGWIRFFYLGILVIFLCLIMRIGFILIEDQNVIGVSNEISYVIPYSSETDIRQLS